ncbi:MAG: ImmA/IrrE family metallo-endopeptidase [Vicinamibacterales bacterium]
MPKIAVPITPAVLDWAVSESGFTLPQLALEAGVELQDLTDWLEARALPGVGEARALAGALRRPVAALLLPAPPRREQPDVRLRYAPGVEGRSLSPMERRQLRRASRLQRLLVSLAGEMHEPPAALPGVAPHTDATQAARLVRQALGVSTEDQFRWKSPSAAFDGWRAAVEQLGVAVFLFRLGPENCRGFSVWHESVPVVAINTAWNDQARTFTLLHEVGHLVARTNSACASGDPAAGEREWDPAERWCESFAAAVLMAEDAVREIVAARLGPGTRKVLDIAQVRRVAAPFQASLRATVLRLIELDLAPWSLYHELTVASDAKRPGGRATGGRDRQDIQEDSLGWRATNLVRRAVDASVVTRAEALTYLDVPDSALDQMGSRSS